jgi:glc operon protein GlcG
MIKSLIPMLAGLAALTATAAAAAPALQPGELSDHVAQAALAAAKARADALGAHVCLVVVDPSGVMKAFLRMEGAPAGCVESAMAKARAAALYRTPTINFMNRTNAGEPALLALPGMVPLGGGVPAKTAGGVWVGAFGSAGSTNPNEVQIAGAGADALAQAADGAAR